MRINEDISSNNKRIAKNTVVLYIRMLFLMVVSLFTTRVILQTLGVEDYGVYNVVGGVVALFAILSQALSNASSRFLNYEMGKGNYGKLKSVFATSVTIQIILAISIAIIAEIIGLWFLNNKMVIPDNRIEAANWVFHFSVLTFCVSLICVPYNAAIIAHEKMSAFAYISIYEGVVRLLICYILVWMPWDKLIAYASLIFFIQFSVQLIYIRYCKRHFSECIYNFSYDKALMKELFSYAGWNFIGSAATVVRTQGGNIIINLFAGPAVNAARGVANQVNHAVSSFSANFMTAVRPQITKSYAAGEIKYMTTLVKQSARLSFYMLLFLSLPIIINIDYILSIWLKVIPEKTSIFVVLTVVFTMIEAFSHPLITAQLATGNVRNFQLIVGSVNFLNIPISYIFLYMGFPPETFLYVAIGLSLVCLYARLFILRANMCFDIIDFSINVILRAVVVALISLIFPFILSKFLAASFLSFILICCVCVLSTGCTILLVGCDKKERKVVMLWSEKIIKKLKKK